MFSILMTGSPGWSQLALLLMLPVCLAADCEYRHIDPQHTMCVFQPRECRDSKLLRE